MTDPARGFPDPSGPPRSFGSSFPLGSNPSFADLLRASSSGREPWASAGPAEPPARPLQVLQGTTILALKFADGVVMAGDRRAVEGFTIADERIDKVFPADETSAGAIAITATPPNTRWRRPDSSSRQRLAWAALSATP